MWLSQDHTHVIIIHCIPADCQNGVVEIVALVSMENNIVIDVHAGIDMVIGRGNREPRRINGKRGSLRLTRNVSPTTVETRVAIKRISGPPLRRVVLYSQQFVRFKPYRHFVRTISFPAKRKLCYNLIPWRFKTRVRLRWFFF